jgi:predicted AAA+ superfamily ATPase
LKKNKGMAFMFYGRHLELEKLRRLDELEKAALIVCMGRRRIGKSTLIEQYAENFKNFIEIQGLAPSLGGAATPRWAESWPFIINMVL